MNPLNGLKDLVVHMGWLEMWRDGKEKRPDGIYLEFFVLHCAALAERKFLLCITSVQFRWSKTVAAK